MSKLILTSKAKLDLKEIRDYIANNLKNRASASRIVSSITRELHTLKQYPKMGRSVDYDVGAEYRMLVCGKYLAFYRIDGDVVYVDRIQYGRRDYLTILFQEQQDEEN